MKVADKKRWFAIYTRHRWEKRVFKTLSESGIESYCPLNKVLRKWSDRLKIVEEPLFKSYVFVKVTEDQKLTVRMTNGVINFIYWLGKPAVVKDKDIVTIKKFLDQHENVEVEKLDFQPNQKVLVTSGAFMDKEARVIDVSKHKVRVVIESVGYALIASIEKSKIATFRK